LNLLMEHMRTRGYQRENQLYSIGVIKSMEVINVEPRNGSFTSNTRRSGRNFVTEKLDRFMIRCWWLKEGFEAKSSILKGSLSNH
jgi:hypothetical protein